jgi:hypothetical protein
MTAITTSTAPLVKPAAAIRAALSEPFNPSLLKCKPGFIQCNRVLAMTYVDARDVADRFDLVLGLDGWQDDFEQLPDGALLCRLRVKIGRTWITRCGVGGPNSPTSTGPGRWPKSSARRRL